MVEKANFKDRMTKRVLMLATTAAMIEQFNKNNIQILESLGYEVHVAGNFDKGNPISDEKLSEFKRWLELKKMKWFNLSSTRKPFDFYNNIVAEKKVEKLIDTYHYAFVHCHTPIGSVIGRIAAYKKKTRIIYTAHGFHFYEGAPLKNWILYYPVEKILSGMTDILITINKEDYRRAIERFKAKNVVYIPGVGIDTKRFFDCKVDRKAKRAELGIKESDFIILSVGELAKRKNQKIVLKALVKLKTEDQLKNIIYIIAGKGNLESNYCRYIKKNGLEEHVKLVGFRSDIDELCKAADCFVHPSIREGFGIATIEAMAAGLPLICSYVNGIKDYTKDGITGCCISPTSVNEMVDAIKLMHDNKAFRQACSLNNKKIARSYDFKQTNEIMQRTYSIMEEICNCD